jgi:hypothetical protein
LPLFRRSQRRRNIEALRRSDASKIANAKAKTQGQGLHYTASHGTARCRVSTYDRWTAQKSEKRFRSA